MPSVGTGAARSGLADCHDLARALWLIWLVGEKGGTPDDKHPWGSAENLTRTIFAFCDGLSRATSLPSEFELNTNSITFTRGSFVTFISGHDATVTLFESQLDRVLYDQWGLYRRLQEIYRQVRDWHTTTFVFEEFVHSNLRQLTAQAFATDLDKIRTLDRIVANGYRGGSHMISSLRPSALHRGLQEYDPTRAAQHRPATVHQTLIDMASSERTALLRLIDRQTDDNEVEEPRGPHRVLICGTRDLTEKQEAIARAIATAIIWETDYVLVSSGRRFRGQLCTDETVVRSAEAATLERGEDVMRRIVHYVREGEEADRERVFVGRVEVLTETKQRTRRLAMVRRAHALVSVGGTTTIDLLATAWSNEELVLPLAWTDGASKDFWFEHRKWIIQRAELNEQDVRLIEEGGAPEAFAAMCVRVLQRYFGRP